MLDSARPSPAKCSLLIGYNLMGFVTGTSLCPPTDPQKLLWIRQDHLLRSVLPASLNPSIINFVAGTASSREVWKNLATVYAKPSHGHIMSICETLSKLNKEEKSISDYMQTVQSLADSFTLAGEQLSQDEITFHILNGLGPEYKKISAAIRATDSSITFAKLHYKLADYEAFLNRNRTIHGFLSPITIHYASCGGSFSSHLRQESNSTPRNSNNRSSSLNKGVHRLSPIIICQFYDLPGHSARHYRKLLAATPWLSTPKWKTKQYSSSSPSLLGSPPYRPNPSSHPIPSSPSVPSFQPIQNISTPSSLSRDPLNEISSLLTSSSNAPSVAQSSPPIFPAVSPRSSSSSSMSYSINQTDDLLAPTYASSHSDLPTSSASSSEPVPPP
ncbi:hypothetical protein FEM48_Zijuj02G0083300 [Ziziphus jujuba var. spinosa]|uniref:Uncharacterized protein n=1 Tax=Ziziphus jujuba var. spinosa TaxID=714518 RepID=A0A978VUN0_ZIZJJ|nr:hypothetical protein FEM48_Zijuj02G0083300 [Ziziphus jujuba var. spinosa]